MLDTDARYSCERMAGVAFYIKRLCAWRDEDGEPLYDGWTVAVMVGDDREHVIHEDDLTVLEDDDYCSQCGQVGCTHDGR